MGRWKDDGSGKPVWDANDSGPDQIQGMPAGGPAPQGGNQPWQGPNGTSLPWQDHAPYSGGVSPAPGGAFNPPNVWQQPEEGDKPGWGPVKITTHFQPGDGHPHPFENGFHMGQKPGQSNGWDDQGRWNQGPGTTGQGGGIPGQPTGSIIGDPTGMRGSGPDGTGPVHFPFGGDYLPGLIKDNNPPNSGAAMPFPGMSPDILRQILSGQAGGAHLDVMPPAQNPGSIFSQVGHAASGGLGTSMAGGLGGLFGGGGGAMSPLIQELMRRQPPPPGWQPEPYDPSKPIT